MFAGNSEIERWRGCTCHGSKADKVPGIKHGSGEGTQISSHMPCTLEKIKTFHERMCWGIMGNTKRF